MKPDLLIKGGRIIDPSQKIDKVGDILMRRLGKPKRQAYTQAMKPKRRRTSRRYFVVLGRKGGQSTSRAKAAAARANGRKGGRPRKGAK